MKPPIHPLKMAVGDDLWEALRSEAESRGRTMTTTAREILREHLNVPEEPVDGLP